jgi:hypothetical protein
VTTGGRRSRAKVVPLAVAVALLAGCGSTAQSQRLSAAGGASAADGSALPGVDGLTAPDAADELGTIGTPGATGPASGAGSAPISGDGGASAVEIPGAPDPGPASGTASAGTNGQSSAATSAPLKIGLLYADNGEANAAVGASTSNSLNAERALKAFVEGFNKSGGLEGRKIQPVYHAIDATSSDYSTQASAACARFTQDNRVAVVFDYALHIRYGMGACLAKNGIPHLALNAADEAQGDALLLFATPGNMTTDRLYRSVLSGLSGTEYVTSEHRVGVLLEDCPHLRRVLDQSVKPTMKTLELQLVSTQTFGCATGFTAAGPAASAIQSAVLAFRSADVDRVLMVSDYEQVALLLFGPQAESQGYRPGYMLSSQAQASVMRANLPSGQWPQLHGVGYARGVDIDDPGTPLPSTDKRCLSLLQAGGAAARGWQDTYVATAICNPFLLLEQALRVTKGDAQGRAVSQAITSLGTSFVAAGTVDGRTRFGDKRTDGPENAAPFSFVTDCSCMRYTGSPVRVP